MSRKFFHFEVKLNRSLSKRNAGRISLASMYKEEFLETVQTRKLQVSYFMRSCITFILLCYYYMAEQKYSQQNLRAIPCMSQSHRLNVRARLFKLIRHLAKLPQYNNVHVAHY
jgi:hypothetical protein